LETQADKCERELEWLDEKISEDDEAALKRCEGSR
jgi:hypothetical protein